MKPMTHRRQSLAKARVIRRSISCEVFCGCCQSLGQCYEGEDLAENTICCHGDGGCKDDDG